MKPHTVLFYFALITVLVTVSVSGREEGEEGGGGGEKKGSKGKPEPIRFAGTYKLDTDPSEVKFGKYLAALGMSPDKIKEVQACKKVLIAIRRPNSTHFNVEKISKKDSISFIFQSGQEFETVLPDGTTITQTINVDKDKMTARWALRMNRVDAKQDIKFFDRGFAINMKANDADAVLRFSKLTEGPIDDDQKYDDWLEEYKKRFFKD